MQKQWAKREMHLKLAVANTTGLYGDLQGVNVAGLIELLRNDFSDRQIFISTHEDMMSAYMRYKFKKYGLEAERLSFKERQLCLS
jgi:hypothetical protein